MIFTREQLLDFFCKNIAYSFCTAALKVFQSLPPLHNGKVPELEAEEECGRCILGAVKVELQLRQLAAWIPHLNTYLEQQQQQADPAQTFADLVRDLTERHQRRRLSRLFHSCWWKRQPSLRVKTTADDVPPCSGGDNGDGTPPGAKRSAESQGQTHPPASSCNPAELPQDQDNGNESSPPAVSRMKVVSSRNPVRPLSGSSSTGATVSGSSGSATTRANTIILPSITEVGQEPSSSRSNDPADHGNSCHRYFSEDIKEEMNDENVHEQIQETASVEIVVKTILIGVGQVETEIISTSTSQS